jgi:hypothetical protein
VTLVALTPDFRDLAASTLKAAAAEEGRRFACTGSSSHRASTSTILVAALSDQRSQGRSLMTDSTYLPMQQPNQDDALVVVEAVSPDLVPLEPRTRGVTLRGDAARDVRESLGSAVLRGVKSIRRGGDATYRLVPSENTARGLADGSLHWATASKGDASVLIKDRATGRIAGHGQLEKVRPSPAKLLGPAAWEAMAMATQQHYLVEINEKLESIEKGMDEVLARMDDDKRGTLKQVHSAVLTSRQRLAEGRVPSAGRREELRAGVREADRTWYQINERVRRHLDAYIRGDGTADELENSWTMLLFATRVLGDASALLTTLPYETVEALEEAATEERDRTLAAVEQVRVLAAELHRAHVNWSAQTADYQLRRTANPMKKAIRAARKTQVTRPVQGPLDHITAWQASQIAAPPRSPAALLVTVSNDSVHVVAEPN